MEQIIEDLKLTILKITYKDINLVYDIDIKSEKGLYYINELTKKIKYDHKVSEEVCRFLIKLENGDIRIDYTLICK